MYYEGSYLMDDRTYKDNCSNSTSAFCIVFGFTFVFSANSLTEGNLSPGLRLPEII